MPNGTLWRSACGAVVVGEVELHALAVPHAHRDVVALAAHDHVHDGLVADVVRRRPRHRRCGGRRETQQKRPQPRGDPPQGSGPELVHGPIVSPRRTLGHEPPVKDSGSAGRRTRKSDPPSGRAWADTVPAVDARDAAHDRQAEPGPFDGPRVRRVAPEEAIEEPVGGLARDPGAGVGHLDDGVAVLRADLDVDPAFVGELERVVDQIARRAGAAARRRRPRSCSRSAGDGPPAARPSAAARSCACATTSSTSRSMTTGSLGIASPASALDSVSIPDTIPASRPLSSAIASSDVRVISGSRSPQRCSICAFALMTVSGVRSSCEASLMNWRSRANADCKRSSIASNALASWPTSSRRFQRSRRSRRSEPISATVRVSRSMGSIADAAMKYDATR